MPPHVSTIQEDVLVDPRSKLVVLVDPYSTGCVVAQEMTRRGYQVMALWTFGFAEEMKLHVPLACAGLEYFAEVTEMENDVQGTIDLLQKTAGDLTIVACLAGGEAGVDFADVVSERMGLLTNGTGIANRRDKKIQQELIAATGMRSVRQAGGDKFEDVDAFLKTESYPLVVKPTESAGSDGVKLCHSYEEAKEHFHLLMKKQLVNGGICPAVLCQEFLRGKEYIVDHVSRDGVHKTCAVWVYERRPANGAAFVYYGFLPIEADSEIAKILITYTRAVLDAIGLKNGPSHGEIMMTEDGPCLVEMNCRANGGDGNWRSLARALTGGYSQIEAAVDCYLDPESFAKYPDKPPSPFKAFGREVALVSYSEGTVKSTPGFEIIKNLPSFVCLESGIKVGSQVKRTIDLVSIAGHVILLHRDPEVVKKDIELIRYLEELNTLFTYETKLENLKRPRGDSIALPNIQHAGEKPHRHDFSAEGPTLIRHMSNDRPELALSGMRRGMTTVDASREVVVMVDPYSTGCCIAQEIQKRGYRIICLWTLGFSEEMKKHVPLSCEGLEYFAEVTEEDTLADTVKAVYQAAGQLRVVACIAGGEAGVGLADALSERLDVRTNGTAIANRRDKKVQQELIKKYGLRSVRQAGGAKFEQVESFLRNEPYPVVIKPIESAGSDGVKLCHDFNEAREHFDLLMKSQMVNGGSCPAVVCQEFLRGKEYVVDSVSRDGIHKTAMVWVYDKRPANGSAFVYFGQSPVDSESPEAKILIPYVRRVLDALGVKNGPSHAEVIMTANGPCLVEMNFRAHGGDGNWRSLCQALNGGYSQVEATADAYLEQKSFFALPDKPPSPFKAAGQEVILVSFSCGTVKATPGFDTIMKLPSFLYLETGVKPGSYVDYTIDLFTGVGSVILVHKDEEILNRDVNTIRQLEKDNALFEYEPESVTLDHSLSKLNLSEMVADEALPETTMPGHHRIQSDRVDIFF